MQPPMNEALITKRRAAVVALVLAVCVGPWGCALNRQRSLQPPSDEVRESGRRAGAPPTVPLSCLRLSAWYSRRWRRSSGR